MPTYITQIYGRPWFNFSPLSLFYFLQGLPLLKSINIGDGSTTKDIYVDNLELSRPTNSNSFMIRVSIEIVDVDCASFVTAKEDCNGPNQQNGKGWWIEVGRSLFPLAYLEVQENHTCFSVDVSHTMTTWWDVDRLGPLKPQLGVVLKASLRWPRSYNSCFLCCRWG